MKLSLLAMVVGASLLPAAASAQTPAQTPQNQEIRFSDELVQASLVRPDEATGRVRRPHAGPSLLRIRAHFVPQMLRSVEQL